jgi:Uma2 family endonuclease
MTTTLQPSSASIVLQGIQWQTYQLLVRDLEPHPGQRLTYDHGLLEILMPLPSHERYKRWLGRIVEIITEEMEIELGSLGSATWSREDLARGIEPDECYYIQNEPAIRGRLEVDLQTDPPPDLAIEIDITSTSLPRLPIYQALKIPEVWRFDGEQLRIFVLENTTYQEVSRSVALPIATTAEIQAFLTQAQTMGETSWAKLVREWARR